MMSFNRFNNPASGSSGPGQRRAKTPLRAQKILATMERGLQKSKRKGELSELQSEESEKAQLLAAEVPEKASQAQDATTQITLGLKRKRSCQLSSKRPRQSCLEILDTGSGARNNSLSIREASSSRSTTTSVAPATTAAEPSDLPSDDVLLRRSVPQVPIFSVSSKREIDSLTNKRSLKDERNPITHSKTGHGTMHYVSSSTGHQVSNRVGAADPAPEGWWSTRMRKLKAQANAEGKQSDLFHGCRIYINGYCGTGVGNKELMRMISSNGGLVDYLPNGQTTHVISAMDLSAKKKQEMLQLKIGRVKKFVRPTWILDSINAGIRKPEHLYAHDIKVQRGVAQMFGGTALKPSIVRSKPTDGKAVLLSTSEASSNWREAAIRAAKARTEAQGPRACL